MLTPGQTYLSPSLSGGNAPPMKVRLLALSADGATAHVRVIEGEWKDWTCHVQSHKLSTPPH